MCDRRTAAVLAASVVVVASTAVIPNELKEMDRRLGEAWGSGRFAEAGDGMLAKLMPGEDYRWVRRLLAPLAGKWLATMP